MFLSAGLGHEKHGALVKVGSALTSAYYEYSDHLTAKKAARNFRSRDKLLHTVGGTIAIEAYTTGNSRKLETDLKKLKMSGIRRYANGISGFLPLDRVGQLASLSSLSFARPVWAMTNVGAVTSQGDIAERADIARSTYGLTGAGVKVGMLSDSFNTGPGSYATDVSTGDLPAGVQILDDNPGGTDEGRAMAQLIYDSAPGVSLVFATAFSSQATFAANILALRDNGANVITDDVIYFAEPMFQDGIIAQAVDNVVASGVSYFASANNQGRAAWDGAYRTGVTRNNGSINSAGGAVHFWGGITHDFDPGAGVDDMQSFTLGPGQSITLSYQWDEAYGSVPGSAGSTNDMDIYVLNAAGTQVVGGATSDNAGAGFDPIEVFQFTNNTGNSANYNLMLTKFSGAAPGLMKWVNFGSTTINEYATNSGPLYGHTNSDGAASVAAAAWYNTPDFGVSPPMVEPYSSRGATPILFSDTGVRLASSITRQRPSITAPDGGNTSFFGGDSGADADSFPNFFGTSAAAPAAAAVAALMLEHNSALTPAQIYGVMQSTAIDMDDPFTGGFDAGYDVATGFGLIRADAAIAALSGSSISGQVFHDANANGIFDGGEPTLNDVTVYIDANNNGIFDGIDTSTTTIGAGNYSFIGLTNGTYNVRQITPAGFIGTTDVNQVVIADNSFSGVNFANMATNYGGTTGGDNYVLRRNVGGTSYEILVGGVLTYTVPVSVSSLVFNLGNGDDTLTVNYLNGSPVPAGGLFYDGGASTAGDSLIVIGSSGNDAITLSNSFTGPTSGVIAIGNPANGALSVELVTVNGGNGNDTLTVNGGLPAVTFNGGLLATDQDTLNVTAGTFTFNADANAGTANLSVNVSSAASVLFNASQHLAALVLSGSSQATLSANGNRFIHTRSLDIAGASKLNLTNNDLILDYNGISPLGEWIGFLYTDVIGLIQSGLNGGAWNGPGIITTQSAAAAGVTTLGVNESADVLGISGSDTALFDGQTVDATAVIVKYTYTSDANLDGIIDGTDYFFIDSNISVPDAFGYSSGDFNYDGIIDGTDYFFIDSNITSQGLPL